MFKLSGKDRNSNLLLEILMIVVGINVALWFEGWFRDLMVATYRSTRSQSEELVALIEARLAE